MKRKLSTPYISTLYARIGISSLSAKLFLPVAALMIVTFIVSILAFNINTEVTQTRLMGQQLDNDAQRLQQSFNQRMESITSAALVLANDPITIESVKSEDEEALIELNDRAVIVRDRFNLDLVQIYDADDAMRVNLVLSNLYRETYINHENFLGIPHFHRESDRLIVLNHMVLPDQMGSVIVGIDLSSELDRLLRQFRLASDVTISVDDNYAGEQGLICGMETGFVGESYIEQYEFPLANRSVCMMLSRPAQQVQQTLRNGLYIMVLNAVFTIVLLSGLLVAITSAIAKPIRNLAEAAQAVSQGDLTRHVTASEVSSIMGIGVDDELSLQAQAFNRMVTELNTLYTNLEDRVNKRTQELSVTSNVAQAVAESRLNLRTMCHAVSKAILREFAFDAVGILQYHEDQSQVCLLAGSHSKHNKEVRDGLCIPVDDSSILYSVLFDGIPRISQVIALEPVQYRIPNLAVTGSYALIPIRTSDKIYGLVYAQHRENNYMTSEITATLGALTGHIAIGFENVELYTVANQARDAAESANKAKSQFLAHMSHELRTPMNAILGFTQVLQRSESIPEHNKDHLDIIYRSGEHLLALINDVLDMSKIEAGRTTLTMTDFDLHEQLDELELMFTLRAQDAGLTLNLQMAPGVPKLIRTDQSKLRQVLINLLGNAIKFTESGSIFVLVSPIDVAKTFTSPLGLSNHQRVSFEVRDTGSGIESNDLERIFEAFVQTESGSQRPQGTGLGLPISREFVRLMGGELSVQSTPGRGSTFRFELDLEIVATIEDPQAINRRVVGVRSEYPLKVLIADDNEANRLLIAQVMRNIGITSREVEDGQQAILVAQTWHPDLIWMDNRMPGMDGHLAAQKIKEYFADNHISCPVIVAITASVSSDAEKLHWCDDVIWKPFHDYKLYNAMHEHLDIEFITEDLQEETDTTNNDDMILAEAMQLTFDTRSKLESAITRLDMQDISSLIGDITSQHPALGHYLQNLEASFDYDTILQYIRRANPAGTA